MAVATSEAARALAMQRWGSTRLDRLVTEVSERSAELGADQLDRLREVVATADSTDLRESG